MMSFWASPAAKYTKNARRVDSNHSGSSKIAGNPQDPGNPKNPSQGINVMHKVAPGKSYKAHNGLFGDPAYGVVKILKINILIEINIFETRLFK